MRSVRDKAHRMRYGLKMSVQLLFRRFLQPSGRMLGRLFMSDGACSAGPARRCGRRHAGWMVGLLAASLSNAWAGAQIEEPLADSVRSALSAAVGRGEPPKLVFADEAQRQQCARWTQAQEARLRKRKPEELVRTEFLNTVCYEAKRAGLDPQLVLGLIQVESGFKSQAQSGVGARGLMQVMPFWLGAIGSPGHDLFEYRTNLRYGCVILRHYLDIERGNLFRALGRYNGSLGRPEYPNMVRAAWHHHWAYSPNKVASK